MALSMEYGDFKLHEADAFELDHTIAYKQSSKFNLQMFSILKIFSLENYPLYGSYSSSLDHLCISTMHV